MYLFRFVFSSLLIHVTVSKIAHNITVPSDNISNVSSIVGVIGKGVDKDLWRGIYLGDEDLETEHSHDEAAVIDLPHEEPPPPEHNHNEDENEEGDGDSDVSEERNPEDFINRPKDMQQVNSGEPHRPEPIVSVISSAFNNRKTFSCPKIKTDLLTGTSIGDLSPEDIGIIASMGDALATGVGLWPQTDIEFRGAAFPIGGDATIDGLVTVPNILREFNPSLAGVSHGMGTREQLPEHQLSVARTGATSVDMPEQANELVRRLGRLHEVNFKEHWVMIIITIGSEEVCSSCSGPSYADLEKTIKILSLGIPKAFVVMIGPIHVSSAYKQKANLLKSRCQCSKDQSEEFMVNLSNNWTMTFTELQNFADNNAFGRPTFGVLALPMLTITSRFPYSLFINNKPLLNRRGHNYATKWLWNRLIAGDKYNLSSAVLSQDSYFCPSTGCPYFRTTANSRSCQLLSLNEAQDLELTLGSRGKVVKMPRRTRKKLYTIAVSVVCIAFFVVFAFGTVFYQSSKRARHGRFELVDEVQKKFEAAQEEEEKALLSRHNTKVEEV